jgi:pyruvate/2-oxoglutarate dehydrogenase complex dihydrolipoamide dehydrogenase (E3) component
LILGSGRFVAPKTLEVTLNDGGTRVLAADKVFLNVGTHAALPSVPGLDAARLLTHVEALELDYLPRHMVVIVARIFDAAELKRRVAMTFFTPIRYRRRFRI